MFNFKKALILLLCTVMLIAAALPAFAVTGYEVKDVNKPAIGVRARCTSHLTTEYAEGALRLSYLPAYSSNYLPEEDYSCHIQTSLSYGALVLDFPYLGCSGMQYTQTISHGGYTCTAATFNYYVNGSFTYGKTF